MPPQCTPARLERLLARRAIDPETGCWNWTGSCFHRGYGQTHYQGKSRRVHRVSAAIYLGFDIESDKFVCHHCDNPKCFNPGHLFIGTHADNMSDYRKKYGGRSRKMTPDYVRSIRLEYKKNVIGHMALAKRHGLPLSTVKNIIWRKTWSHIL